MSNRYRCRSAQLTKQARLQGTMRLSGATYTVGSGRRAAPWGRPYGRAGNLTLGRTLCIPTKNEKRSGGPPIQKQDSLHPWWKSILCCAFSYKYWKLGTTMPKCSFPYKQFLPAGYGRPIPDGKPSRDTLPLGGTAEDGRQSRLTNHFSLSFPENCVII